MLRIGARIFGISSIAHLSSSRASAWRIAHQASSPAYQHQHQRSHIKHNRASALINIISRIIGAKSALFAKRNAAVSRRRLKSESRACGKMWHHNIHIFCAYLAGMASSWRRVKTIIGAHQRHRGNRLASLRSENLRRRCGAAASSIGISGAHIFIKRRGRNIFAAQRRRRHQISRNSTKRQQWRRHHGGSSWRSILRSSWQ